MYEINVKDGYLAVGMSMLKIPPEKKMSREDKRLALHTRQQVL